MGIKDFLPYLNWAAVGGATSSCPEKEGGEKRRVIKAEGFIRLTFLKRGEYAANVGPIFKWQSLSDWTLWTQRKERKGQKSRQLRGDEREKEG